MLNYEIKTVGGVQVLFAPMQDSTSVTIEILVKAGSVYETKKTNGLSHFLEHMFFKGGKKYPTPKSVAETIDAVGGEFNAFTGNDYAGYYVKSAPEHVFTALDVLSDMMVHPIFPKEEMEKEKGVVVQEIKMYEDRPDMKVLKLWDRGFLGDNSYGRPIIGPEENVLAFTQEDLFQHKHNLYTKENLLITIAGKITDQESLETHIATLFADLPATGAAHIPPFSPTHPAGGTREVLKQGTNQDHFVLGGLGYSYNDADKYAARLLATIVGGTMSSRLFQEIREKRGLCYYIGCSHQSSPEYGVFIIRAGISKEKYEEGIQALKEELTKIAQGAITEAELQNAKGFMIGKTQVGIETSDELADFFGAQQLLYGNIDTLDTILEKYKSVTLADIHRVAQKLLPENLYGYTIG